MWIKYFIKIKRILDNFNNKNEFSKSLAEMINLIQVSGSYRDDCDFMHMMHGFIFILIGSKKE